MTAADPLPSEGAGVVEVVVVSSLPPGVVVVVVVVSSLPPILMMFRLAAASLHEYVQLFYHTFGIKNALSQFAAFDFPVSEGLLASLVHVPGGAHEVVPLGQVDVHRPVALLDRFLDGELEGYLHDCVYHAVVQLGHVRDGANVVRLQGGCRKMNRSQGDLSIVSAAPVLSPYP